MNYNTLTLESTQYPHILREYSGAPQALYHVGAPLGELMKLPRVAIVGNRSVTNYGRQVTIDFASKLAEQGVVIISGLAYGVDAIAHQATLDVGGKAIAVLPSPLDNIVPTNHRRLAQRIIDEGGALVSQYAPGNGPFKQYFIERNWIVSGLADVVVIIEGSLKSGSMYTAKFGHKQDKDVLAVPGNITIPNAAGTNNLIKRNVAAIATDFTDVLQALKLEHHVTPAKQVRGRNAQEQTVLDLMMQGVNDGAMLLDKSNLTVSKFNEVLTMLEIGGKVRPLGANNWGIV